MNLKVQKYNQHILAVLLTIMVCITKISMAVGNILFGVSIAFSVYLYFYSSESFENYTVPRHWRLAFILYGIMLASIIPSVFTSDDIFNSAKAFFNIWIIKIFVLYMILKFIQKKSILVGMLIIFFLWTSFDSIVSLINALILISEGNFSTARVGGFGGTGVMGFAMILTSVFPVALIMCLSNEIPIPLKRTATLTVITSFGGMLGTQSRMSWLSNGFQGILISLGYTWRHRKRFIVFLGILYCLSFIFVQSPYLVERLESVTNITTNGSNLGRLYGWKSSLEMIKDHPITGVGPKQWQVKYRHQYRYIEETQDLGHAHNNFVQVASESGVLGLVGFMFMVIGWISLWICRWWKYKNPYALAILTSSLGFLVFFGMIDYTWGSSSIIRVYLFMIAILMQLERLSMISSKNFLVEDVQ